MSTCQKRVYSGARDYKGHICGRVVKGTGPRSSEPVCGLHLAAEQRKVDKAERARQEAVERDLRAVEGKAKANELNARIEGLTGEPGHVRVSAGKVFNLTVEDLEDILRKAEDTVLGVYKPIGATSGRFTGCQSPVEEVAP